MNLSERARLLLSGFMFLELGERIPFGTTLFDALSELAAAGLIELGRPDEETATST